MVWNDYMATNTALDGNFQFPSITLPRLSHSSHVQLHASLWTIARQAPLSMEFSRQACWSGLPCPPPGDGPNPGIKPRSPALEGEFFTTDPPEKPPTTSPAQPCLILQAYVIAQLLSHVRLFVTPWTALHQVPLSSTVSWSLLKFISTESVMLSNYLNLCHPYLLLPSVFPSIRVFSNEKVLPIR